MLNMHLSFHEAIMATGLEPPERIVPGKIHRFPGKGKGRGNKAGWCLLDHNGKRGCFGDWSSGIDGTWRAERDSRHAVAKARAAKIWNKATTAPDNHPYLLRKYIQVHGAKLYKGALLLPVMDFNGELTSLQFIRSDGDKRLLSGGRKQGCFIPVPYTQNTQNAPVQDNFADIAQIAYGCSKIIICEGWATGCTLAEVYPNAMVLAAIDAGNLQSVAMMTRRYFPDAKLVIAGDDDRLTDGNPGASKAKAAAIASNALLALPQWPEDAPTHLTDFNDLAVWLAGGGV